MKKEHQDTAMQMQAPVKAETTKPKIETVPDYQYKETRELVQLVTEAANLLREKGEVAFNEFRIPGSSWRKEETYVFVLDPEGNMLVHPDPNLEGKNQIGLKDINGKPIIRGLLGAATTYADKPEGWFHYQWNVPGELLPRWKSSFVRLVKTASGKSFIIGSGLYNDRMERDFIVDAVKNAVGEIEKRGREAFQLFHDPTGPFIVKDAYIFVTDMNGIELVNPAFPNLEGRKLLDLKDTQGKFLNRELIKVVRTSGSGWVDYMWPKPGESISTLKSTYVSKAKLGDQIVMVGCGVYLADAPRETKYVTKMTASELMTLVRQAADMLREKGENAYSEFREKGSKWFSDETYFFVFTMDGTRDFHAAEPESKGRNDITLKDVLGRPIVQMILEAGTSPFGEGWVHYMYPEPGSIFPAWKSSFVKLVSYPSGKQYIVGCGIYNMEMDKAFIMDIVNRATALVEDRGKEAFGKLRDKTGPFVFMNTYVFVQSPDGTELVNPGQPSLEGRNLMDLKDLKGKAVIKEEIDIAMTEGSAWLDLYWYKPGDNKPALKQTYVRKAQFEGEIYIVGSGLYGEEGPDLSKRKGEIQKISWETIEKEKLSDTLSRQMIFGEKATLAKIFSRKGTVVARHFHFSEEYALIVSGEMKYNFDDREVVIRSGEVIIVPSNIPHSIVTMEDSESLIFFAPMREDWLRGEDQYLRR